MVGACILCFLYSILGALSRVAWGFDFGTDVRSLFLFFSVFYFFSLLVYHPADGREKKEKGVASGTANLTGGERIKNTQGMNEMEWVRRGLWHSCFLLVFVLLRCFLFDGGVHFVCCFHHSFTCVDSVCLYHDLVLFLFFCNE